MNFEAFFQLWKAYIWLYLQLQRFIKWPRKSRFFDQKCAHFFGFEGKLLTIFVVKKLFSVLIQSCLGVVYGVFNHYFFFGVFSVLKVDKLRRKYRIVSIMVLETHFPVISDFWKVQREILILFATHNWSSPLGSRGSLIIRKIRVILIFFCIFHIVDKIKSWDVWF